MKIIELLIDDTNDITGVDGVALVDQPAHESTWLTFNKEELEKNHLLLDDVLTEEEQITLAEMLNEKGMNEQDLLDEGYTLVAVEPVHSLKQEFAVINVNGVDIYTAPNGKSSVDSLGARRKRYKYVGPRDSKNRRFCGAMMTANKIFRIEDIQDMTANMSNAEFGYYDIFKYRGSYNCRHQWVALYYEPTANIINNTKRRKGLAQTEAIPNEPTITRKTAEAQEQRGETTAVALGLIDLIDDIPLFDNPEQAIKLAEVIGCSGYHTHTLEDGTIGYMPCETHEFESYNDYPEGVKEAAQRALRWVEKNGWGSCGTDVGKQRANQLAKGENISEETIQRMFSFLSRHKGQGADTKEYGDGCGRLMYDAWGGDAGLSWSERKLQQIENEQMSISGIGDSGCGCYNIQVDAPVYVDQISGKTIEESVVGFDDLEDACWAGYEPYGLKPKNGRMVPNCVKVENAKMQFSYDSEKKEVIGAAMIPNKMIIRRDPFSGQLYYVYFSKETIAKLSEKFMRSKKLDSTNIMHTNQKADSFISESWIVDDAMNDKSRAYGFTFPEGTWVIKMKIDSNELWTKIKDGKYNGFSVEGTFAEKLIFRNINNNSL